ncbi:hypothetical protein DFP74_1990 [Nocardiopsis sp. Huas11]|uniref:hypothetical protein n=1 Tax=Nocardiopsis sp. Huas11 TaxID=2183912 RepID=UPI000EB2C16B|nr:hypothetical protein [Nocardiopsis sp. Huas11]RKS06362.1 hypothetical protein DFP74_1990 [Nocardiopsis sp. Huas11]
MIDPTPEAPSTPLGVADVPWHTLGHAYGSATDVPELLVTAFGADEDAAREAIDEIDTAVCHQGGAICSAAPAVLPFLVELAADVRRAREVRRDALLLVFTLAEEAVDCDPSYVHPDWAAALSGQVPRLAGLLDDADPLVRREAADALAYAVADVERVLTDLHDRWRVEEDALTRLTLLADAADLLNRHPRARAVLDAVEDGRAEEDAHAPAVRWLVDRRRYGDADERVVLPAAEAPVSTPSEGLRLAFDAVRGLEREEAPLWAAARLHEPATRERVAGFAPHWLLSRFSDRPDARGELAARMLGADTGYLRRAGLVCLAGLVGASRSAEARWAPALAGLLADPDEGVRSHAALVLAVCVPQAAGPWADRLAALAAREPGADSNHALFALARLGEGRVVELLRARAHLPGFGLPAARGYADGWTLGPHLTDVLRPLAALADGVVPPLRHRLRTSEDADERDAVVDALAAWGAAAAPLAPEITAELSVSRYPRLVLGALGEIGSAASSCADLFLEWARGREAPEMVDRADALLAYWRVTGDTDTALDLLGSDPESASARSDAGLRLIGELGPAAERFAETVRDHVREAEFGLDPTALRALWRVTGTADEVLRCVLAEDESWWKGGAGVDSLRVVRLLGDMGASAETVLPGLREVLSRDRRVRQGRFGWRDVVFDHEYTAAARAAVERIESGAAPE